MQIEVSCRIGWCFFLNVAILLVVSFVHAETFGSWSIAINIAPVYKICL